MMSEGVRRILKVVVNAGNILGYFPYKFEGDSRSLQFDSSLRAKVKFWANFLGNISYQIYLVVRAYQTVSDPSKPLQFKVTLAFMALFYACFNFTYYITFQNYGQQHVFFNQVLDATSNLDAGESSQSEGKSWTALLGVLLPSSTALLATVLRAVRVLKVPSSPELLTSMFPNPTNLHPGLRLVFGVIHSILSGFTSYSMAIHGIFIIVYVVSVLAALRPLKVSRSSNARRTLAAVEQLARTIRTTHFKLAILQTKFNAMYGIWPLGFEVCCLFMVIVRLFLAILLLSGKDAVVGLFMLATVLIFFNTFAQVHDVSQEVQSSWESLKEPKWFLKFRSSCKPLSISVGGFFVADKQLVLTIISLVILNTMNLAIGFKESRRF